VSDAVLVVGGGIGGLRAALDLAHAGAQIVLVENKATVGGKLAALLEEGRTALDLPEGAWLPTLAQVAAAPQIEILTLSEVVGLTGEPGEFAATIRSRSRFVSDVCDQCNVCRQVCPVVRPNEYDAGLSFRKAIFSPLKNPVPSAYVIDIDSCLNDPPNYIPCQRCVQHCHVNAISFDTPLERTITRDVGSVVIAAGFDLKAGNDLERFGYGKHPDVVTSLELERLFAASGATGGYVERPSDERDPERVLIVVADGTDFTWNYTARQTKRMFDQALEDITILYEVPADSGKGPSSFLSGSVREKARLIHGTVDSVNPNPEGRLTVAMRDARNGGTSTDTFDLVVVATAVQPPAEMAAVSEALGIRLGSDGFVRTMEKDGARVATSRPGVYACGCVTGPKNIHETLADAAVAVEQAFQHARRGTRRAGPPKSEPTASGLSDAELRGRMCHVVETLIAMGEKRISGPEA
jgi:heterodisulfide reductase subunit A